MPGGKNSNRDSITISLDGNSVVALNNGSTAQGELVAESGTACSITPCPPSFEVSEFDTIIRRQRTKRPDGLKFVNIRSRFSDLGNQWEFAGWGMMTYLGISSEELLAADQKMNQKLDTVGQLRGTGLPGNSMTSSVFYAFPAVIAVASIFSPISLFVACLVAFLWKPIFLELGSAIRLNGGNYTYLLQVSGTTMSLVGAAVTLLDSVATSTESAATAASYLGGEFDLLTASSTAITILILFGLAILCLVNIRRSSTMTLVIFIIHMTMMLVLMLASVVAWSRRGSHVLISNWDLRPRGMSATAKAIFNGICVGFLGVTGFETTPTYIEAIDKESYSSVLRNVLICNLALNAPLMICVFAILPMQSILGGANILSVLAESVAGRWLRILIVTDSVLVLSGGVIDGICAACALLERLAKDGVFSKLLLRTMPGTGSPYIGIAFAFVLNILLYAASAFDLSTISSVFTITFLSTLMLFVWSDFLLKFNHDRLPGIQLCSLLTLLVTLAVNFILLGGNIAIEPKILGLFAGYFLLAFLPLFIMKVKDDIARLLLWVYYQSTLKRWSWTSTWDGKIIGMIQGFRSQPVVVWVSRDDLFACIDDIQIHDLVNYILYVRENETTAHIIFAHAYDDISLIPQELGPNIKILDEAFPTITIELMFLIEAVSIKRNIPRTKMFFGCPSINHGWNLGEYQGVRIAGRT
ncbi:amino acid permease-domain-containing protein [Hysterangium stoloniferum]|nr:amino acid permease-domain-containing protein [Hysterangium stoloniferum]